MDQRNAASVTQGESLLGEGVTRAQARGKSGLRGRKHTNMRKQLRLPFVTPGTTLEISKRRANVASTCDVETSAVLTRRCAVQRLAISTIMLKLPIVHSLNQQRFP